MFDVKKGVYGENPVDESAFSSGAIAATRGVAVGGVNGRVYLQIIAGNGGFTLHSGKKVTYTVTSCATIDGAYASALSGTAVTVSADTVYAEGDVIASIEYPRSEKVFAKVTLACDDASVSGKVKVIAEY